MPAVVPQDGIHILHECRHQKFVWFLCTYMYEEGGPDLHPALANHVIPILVGSGSLRDAHTIFNSLLVNNLNHQSWNTLISGYVDNGDYHQAFHLFHQMRQAPETCVHPDRVTFLALLNASAKSCNVEQGQTLYAQIIQRGLQHDQFLGAPILGNAIVHMYGKCGSFAEAHHAFEGLPTRDLVSWTALIAGYAEHKLYRHIRDSLLQMVLEGVSPDAVTFVSCLKACGTSQASELGQKLHSETVKQALESQAYVGSSLMNFYIECGLPSEAHCVLYSLPGRNIASWSALIGGYAKWGCNEEACSCFKEMMLDGFCPNSFTLGCIMKSYCHMHHVERGRQIHIEIVKRGFEREPSMGNMVVDAYGKCGLLAEALQMFEQLGVRDVVSWTSLITGFTEHGYCDKAREFFLQMQQEGIFPDYITFCCGLKSFCEMCEIETGQEMHSEAVKRGLDSMLCVANVLVDMYCKCKLLVEAYHVFAKLPNQDAVTWTSLISGYADVGLNEEANLQQMQIDGTSLDPFVFSSSLKACGTVCVLGKGHAMHSEAVKFGCDKESHVGGMLVDMYAQCGSITEALKVLDGLHDQTIFSWNSLIVGLTDWGLSGDAVMCYTELQLKGFSPDSMTFIDTLKAYWMMKDLEAVQGVHSEIVKHGLEGELAVANALVVIYNKSGLLAEACQVFSEMPIRVPISWAAMIAGYIEHGNSEEGLKCFLQMRLKSACPERNTFIASLKACGVTHRLQMGMELHAETAKRGLQTDLYVGSALVDMYIECGSLAEAQNVFDGLPDRSAPVWNTMISGYVELGLNEEAMDSFDQMLSEGISPDSITLCCSMKACGTLQTVEKGFELHIEILKRGLEKESTIGTALVAMYSQCDALLEAQKVFDGIPTHNVPSCNALLSGYVQRGLDEEARRFFQQMLFKGVFPDSVTFVYSLKACCTTGSFDMGLKFHTEIMKRGIEKEIHVGGTLLEMYTEHGFLVDAYHVFMGLSVKDAVSWVTLIVGYTEYGLGKEATLLFEQMMFEGISPDLVTLLCNLKACGMVQVLETGQVVHREAVKRGMDKELQVGRVLVDLYAKCGSLTDARQVLQRLPVRDAASWTVMIEAYAEHGFGDEMGVCFQKMQLEGMFCDSTTFGRCLKVSIIMGSIESGQEMHDEAVKRGLERKLHVGNALVDMYGSCGLLAEARQVFEQLNWRDVISWTVMIKAYGKNHKGKMAVLCFEEMQEQGVQPCSITFISLLAACSHSSLFNEGQHYFFSMKKKFKIEPRVEHLACMVDLFARSGRVYEAEKFAAAMECTPSSLVLNDLLSACKSYGKLELGQKCFQHLVDVDSEAGDARA